MLKMLEPASVLLGSVTVFKQQNIRRAAAGEDYLDCDSQNFGKAADARVRQLLSIRDVGFIHLVRFMRCWCVVP